MCYTHYNDLVEDLLMVQSHYTHKRDKSNYIHISTQVNMEINHKHTES